MSYFVQGGGPTTKHYPAILTDKARTKESKMLILDRNFKAETMCTCVLRTWDNSIVKQIVSLLLHVLLLGGCIQDKEHNAPPSISRSDISVCMSAVSCPISLAICCQCTLYFIDLLPLVVQGSLKEITWSDITCIWSLVQKQWPVF